MNRVVVDTNILFSTLRSGNPQKLDVFFHLPIEIYAPKFIIVEIFEHKERIISKSKISKDEVYELLDNLLQKIQFINNDLISFENYLKAYNLCKEIDEDDTPFIALALELKAKLWSNDQILKNHLKSKGFVDFYE
jgi:predicted nucleic acid-binding protein